MTNEMSGPLYGQAVQAETIHGGVHFHGPARPAPRLRLPRLPRPFLNRTEPHQRMSELLARARAAGGPFLVALYGPGGVGVTSAAGQWASQHRDEFAGVTYLEFENKSISDAFGEALAQLGVDDIPAEEGRRQALLWRVVADRPVLFLLDNVTSRAQAAAFTPGEDAPTCAVVVAAPTRLPALSALGYQQIPIAPLDPVFGVRLLSVDLSAREAEAVVRACAGFPLAIKLADGALDATPAKKRAVLLRRIEEVGFPAVGAEELRLVHDYFDVLYDGLADPVAATYRALAALPGPEFSHVLAAQVTETEHLDTLVRAHLLEETDDRYRLHRLLHDHVRTKSTSDELATPRRRAVEWCLRSAVAADKAISDRWRISELYYQVAPMADRATAIAFLHTERENLVAAAKLADDIGRDDLTWQFGEALWHLLHLNGLYDDWIMIHELGLAAAHRLGHTEARMHLVAQLASARLGLGELDEADRLFAESFELAEQTGHVPGMQSALEWRGKIRARRGDHDAALEWYDRSWAVGGDERTFALLRLQKARSLNELGRFEQALTEALPAQTVFDAGNERDNQAKTRLARARALLGLREDAVDLIKEAVGLFAEDRSLRSQADALDLLAEATGDSRYGAEAEEIRAKLIS